MTRRRIDVDPAVYAWLKAASLRQRRSFGQVVAALIADAPWTGLTPAERNKFRNTANQRRRKEM